MICFFIGVKTFLGPVSYNKRGKAGVDGIGLFYHGSEYEEGDAQL